MIQEAIKNIDCRKYLLPAIQRKFIWDCSQICVLFDSIMRGYPINTFMFWQVTSPEIRKGFRFYQFMEHYCERFEENNRDFDTKGHCADDDGFMAVIDGQQRLNSLYIGLKGTYAYKMPRKWWPSVWDEAILPKRKLYLNLIAKAPDVENEEMMAYDFRFLTVDEYKSAQGKADQWWFEVGDVLTMKSVSIPADVLQVVTEYLEQQGLDGNAYAFKALTRLYFAIRIDRLIHYYKENNQEMDHVLDIFIRTNHGGTPLSFSELLMSIAVANWKNDAREQIDRLIESARVDQRMGFIINRDFVLKASLMLTDANVRFRVSNFSSGQVEEIERKWDDIRVCLIETFRLVHDLGFRDDTLRAKNAVIPIACYLFHKNRNTAVGEQGLFKSINNLAYHAQERKVIRKWLARSLLKGVFGGQGDAVLTKLRETIKANLGGTVFPLTAIADVYRGTPKSLDFDDDYIDRLLTTQKEDGSCFLIISLLSPDLDYTRSLDIDHLHPAAAFTNERLDACDFLKSDFQLRSFYENEENWNSVVNLQLLDSSKNRSKQDMSLIDWVDSPNGPRITDLNIDPGTDLTFSAFKEFIEARARLLKNLLKAL
jgi:hypothetical protein